MKTPEILMIYFYSCNFFNEEMDLFYEYNEKLLHKENSLFYKGTLADFSLHQLH